MIANYEKATKITKCRATMIPSISSKKKLGLHASTCTISPFILASGDAPKVGTCLWNFTKSEQVEQDPVADPLDLPLGFSTTISFKVSI